jgi:hypothetical protein
MNFVYLCIDLCIPSHIYENGNREFIMCFLPKKLEHPEFVCFVCVIIVGYCGHAVPRLIVVCFHHVFLVEPCGCPPCAGTELKRKVFGPMSNSPR